MKKLLILTISSLLLLSCGNKENTSGTDAAISGNNLEQMKKRRSELQAELTKIDQAIASLDTIEQEALVAVIAVKDTTFTHYVELQGNVDTKENVLIQPEMSGALISLNVKAGQRVKKGQVLGRVDDAGLSQQVAQLETQLALARTTYERQKKLWDQKIGSEIQFLQAQTAMKSQERAVAQMRAQLSKTLIKAPFSGTIDEVFVERGEVVAPSQQGLMRIVNLGDMYVSTSVPETYINKVKQGSPVTVSLPSLGKDLTGKIRQVGNYIDPANRTFGIEVSVPNPGNILRPNQVAKLKIVDYVNNKAAVVPSNVIQQDAAGKSYVYVVNNINGKTGVAKKVTIEAGQSGGNLTEIRSGLSAGDVVVTEGVSALSEGMKINF
ncbi:MAG TPA: efflux RND transporter periplasmic adaptor subunit [Flavobacterium sp.]